ncbi:cytochrome P450 4C1-like isoform X2 [Rhynchophorus ferrugineus]|uniref:cytochrome P450 4C1-like isoform X2 n=1 Tax=Rhynchophorus ferrugineus TaxID=354439 RepID=UPI003FCDF681
MDTIKSNRLLTFFYTPKKLVSYELYLISITFIVLFWLLKFLWGRRNLYKSASKLPGPYGLPIVGSSLRFLGQASDIYKCIDSLFLEYHSANIFKVWFGTKLVYCTADAKVFDIVFTSPHALRKEPFYNLGDNLFGGGLFSQKSIPKWRRNRKFITPAFNSQMLNSFMGVFVQRSNELIQFMRQYEKKKDVDLYDFLSRYALKTICDTAMGVNIDTEPEGDSFNHWIVRALEILIERIFNIYYQIDIIFCNSALGKEFLDLCNKSRSFTRKIIVKKRQQMEEEKKNKDIYYEAEGRKLLTFIDMLLKVTYEDNKSYFTDEEIVDETITLMGAGSDTTSNTNAFALVLLGMHQDIQEKVLAEILEVVGPERNVCVDDLPHLKFLERVIKETLRVFPVGPILARTLDGDINVGDHVLSKGGSICFGVLRLHRSEKYWPNALKFDPDRFLPENAAKIKPGSYVPFSYGPRNCLGLRYAMMTMKVILATILRRYKVFTDYKSIEEIDIKCSVMTRPINGYKLYYESRK